MSKDKVIKQILDGLEKAGKTFAFDEDHDPNQPVEMWFQESDEGLILFLVFFSQACRWSQCMGCNLSSKSSREHISYRSLIAQIDAVFSDPEVIRCQDDIRKIIVSNNGSILDQETFSSTALMYLLTRLNLTLPKVAALSIETRPEHVEFAELEFMARALGEGDEPTALEIAIGFEAMDDKVRNQIFQKGLSLEVFEELVSRAAPYGYHIKTYFMQKPVPGMSDREAVGDIRRAIDYLSKVSDRYGVRINMHLNPTFVARGTPLEDAFRKGEFTPPALRDVAEATLHARDKPISVFIGLSDEGLAVQGGSFIREGDENLVSDLERFNRTQDYDILAWISSKKGSGNTT